MMDKVNQLPRDCQDRSEIAVLVDRFLRRVHANLHPRAQRVDTAHVGPFGGLMMMALAELEPAPMLELVAHLGRDKSQVTRVIQSLERKGMIARSRSATDGRIIVVSLTEAGRALVAALTAELSGVIGELTAGLTALERAQFLAILRKL